MLCQPQGPVRKRGAGTIVRRIQGASDAINPFARLRLESIRDAGALCRDARAQLTEPRFQRRCGVGNLQSDALAFRTELHSQLRDLLAQTLHGRRQIAIDRGYALGCPRSRPQQAVFQRFRCREHPVAQFVQRAGYGGFDPSRSSLHFASDCSRRFAECIAHRVRLSADPVAQGFGGSLDRLRRARG